MTWQLQEAKNKLSEVVETSLTTGPQIISRHGKNTAVIISYDDYQNLTQPKSPKAALMALKDSEFDFSDLDLERDQSTEGRATPVIFE